MVRVAIRLLLILVLAYTGVRIWYNRLEVAMLSSVPVAEVAAARPVEKKTVIRRQADDYRVIINRNIFGAAVDTNVQETAATPVEQLKPTSLKLSLMGTVFGDSESSRAIIADETSRKQDIYAVGDTIQGAHIKAIERRRVVLRVNGNDEVLNIKERESGPADTRFTAAQPSAARRTLQERLTVRRPTVRPPLPNRPRPVVRTSPEQLDTEEFADEDIPEEFDEDFQDQEPEEFDDAGFEDEEFPEEPDFIDDEPIDEPELKDEEQY